jgi:hypothetical protein
VKAGGFRPWLRLKAQEGLTRVGAHLSHKQIRWMNASLNYLEAGRWLRANGFSPGPRFPHRKFLYPAVAERCADEQVLYLEFGVWTGNSMRQWSQLLRNPLSSLHGFDTFTGLPEVWDEERPRGAYSAGDNLPRFDDPRIVLHRGLFTETLPRFEPPPHERLVLNLDADLYSSTIYVLQTLHDTTRPGTIVIFDEFCDRLHELRAFKEYLAAFSAGFRCLGATANLEHVAFERTR